MKVRQSFITKGRIDAHSIVREEGFSPQWILIFADRRLLMQTNLVKTYREFYPQAVLMGCSTSGEIMGERVSEETAVVSMVQFEHSRLSYHAVCKDDYANSSEAGEALINGLDTEGLRHVFVLSEGLHVNGTELVKGMLKALPAGVNATGGLAGDGDHFRHTVNIINDGLALENYITAVGFYGDKLEVGYGSLGGWDSFGIERSVTRSEGNVLYEIDNRPALDLYKSFLGEKADELPASGLLFPLSMRVEASDEPLVRTILAVDEESKSLTFAGDIPEGAQVKLMKANIDRLITGAEQAAKVSIEPLKNKNAELAVLISCVGRKLVLKQMVEEEVEAVRDTVGDQAKITGFYSYGEIAPFLAGAKCELHNQTMTITTFSEK